MANQSAAANRRPARHADGSDNWTSQACHNMVFLNHDFHFTNRDVGDSWSRPDVSSGGR
jgi:hypothetical protein